MNSRIHLLMVSFQGQLSSLLNKWSLIKKCHDDVRSEHLSSIAIPFYKREFIVSMETPAILLIEYEWTEMLKDGVSANLLLMNSMAMLKKFEAGWMGKML